MNSTNKDQNYDKEEAMAFARKILSQASRRLLSNTKMWLPPGNDTRVLPPRYQYQLSASEGYEKEQGVYCHYDDELFYFVASGRARNNYNRDVINKYAIGEDSILNIFMLPHHPDSIQSPSYKATYSGIALGKSLKMTGLYENIQASYKYQGLLNHEIGHVLGLRHSWTGSDGCPDTPNNPNCWGPSETAPCDSLASNNLMDYNADQNAWTPCQIGRIHANFSKLGSRQRDLLVPDWCTYNAANTIQIQNKRVWRGSKDLNGDIIIEPGGELHIHCRLSLANKAKITVRPGGKLFVYGNAHLHNDCGEEWQGIELEKSKGQTGKVEIAADAQLENMEYSIEIEKTVNP